MLDAILAALAGSGGQAAAAGGAEGAAAGGMIGMPQAAEMAKKASPLSAITGFFDNAAKIKSNRAPVPLSGQPGVHYGEEKGPLSENDLHGFASKLLRRRSAEKGPLSNDDLQGY